MQNVSKFKNKVVISLRKFHTCTEPQILTLMKFRPLGKYKVRVATTMTHIHDDLPHAIFNTISGTCWKVSEFLDFNLKNRNNDRHHDTRSR